MQKPAQAAVEEEVVDVRKVERRTIVSSRRVRHGEARDGGEDGEGNSGDEKDDENENSGDEEDEENEKLRKNKVNVAPVTSTVTSKTVSTITVPSVSIFTTTATRSIDSLSATPPAPPAVTSTVTATIPETITLTGTTERPSLQPPDLFPQGSLSRSKPSVGVIVGAVFATILFVILIPLALWIMRHIRRRLRVASSEFTIVADGTVRPHPFSRILSRPEPQMVERGPISSSRAALSSTDLDATPPFPFNDSYRGSDPPSFARV